MQWSFGNIHGNVKTLLQDNKKMATTFTSIASQRYKRMDYRYDLVSGNVHRMSVQNGEVDQWHHAYQYDADNRITAAYTNTQTPIIGHGQLSAALENEMVYNSDWENDAKYYYYAHGPLARTEIGNDQLQGFDFIYNLQGWMKGINAIENTNDPGQDGIVPSAGINPNWVFGKDLTAFSLEYFNTDYQAINSATPFANVNTSSHPATNSSQLFNGNIRYMQTRLTNPTTLADMPMLNAYKYDQLNRLKESRSYETGLTSNVWNPTTYGNSYYNSFTYDAMGNIENQIRHSRNGTLIDNLTYHYQKSGGKLVRNRLYHLNDAQTNAAAFTDDIDNMLTFRSDVNRLNVNNNYNYDEEGRLVKDSSERINKIVWRVDGKVKEIQRNGGSAKWLRFDYDAMGRRIAKHIYANNGSTHEKSTYYVLDAQGNQISTYDYEVVGGSAKFHLKERNIFGSSRIGSKQDSINILTATLSQNYTQVLGKKYYEFTNHLGNVLTVFTDLKVALDENSNNVVDGYKVQVLNISDYSPFGVQLDGRTLQNDFYRRGFNGMEKDNEVKGGGNSYSTDFRQYDARIGRWLSLDPLIAKFPWQSPFVAFDNNPLINVDNDGRNAKTPPKGKIHVYKIWFDENNKEHKQYIKTYSVSGLKCDLVKNVYAPSQFEEGTIVDYYNADKYWGNIEVKFKPGVKELNEYFGEKKISPKEQEIDHTPAQKTDFYTDRQNESWNEGNYFESLVWAVKGVEYGMDGVEGARKFAAATAVVAEGMAYIPGLQGASSVLSWAAISYDSYLDFHVGDPNAAEKLVVNASANLLSSYVGSSVTKNMNEDDKRNTEAIINTTVNRIAEIVIENIDE